MGVGLSEGSGKGAVVSLVPTSGSMRDVNREKAILSGVSPAPCPFFPGDWQGCPG